MCLVQDTECYGEMIFSRNEWYMKQMIRFFPGWHSIPETPSRKGKKLKISDMCIWKQKYTGRILNNFWHVHVESEAE